MRVERLRSALEWLARTEPLRSAEPILTNVMTTVAQGTVAGRNDEGCDWYVVSDVPPPGRSATVLGAALRTMPWNLLCSPMPAEAAVALAAALDGVPSGVSGQPDVVSALVEALVGGGRAVEARTVMRDVVRVLGTFTEPTPVRGAPRRASPADLEALVDWHLAFAADAGLPWRDPRESVLGRLAGAGLWWWELDGVAVSLAGHAPLVPGRDRPLARLGPVYTPGEHRRQGYGSAVTAAVVRQLVAREATVMLYADADNPTSNHIYARLGFAAVGEAIDVELRSIR